MNAEFPNLNKTNRFLIRRRGMVIRLALIMVPMVLFVMGATQSSQRSSGDSSGPALIPINPPPDQPIPATKTKADSVVRIKYAISPQRMLQFRFEGQVFEARSWDELSRLARKCFPGQTIHFEDSQGTVRRIVQKAMIGVLLEPVEGAVASQLRLHDDSGILIQKVYPGLPADRAGMRQFDVVVECNEVRPLSQKTFSQILSQSAPQDVLNLVVLRGGAETELHVTLAPYDAEAMAANSEDTNDFAKEIEEMLLKYEAQTGKSYFPNVTIGAPLDDAIFLRPEGESPTLISPQQTPFGSMSIREFKMMTTSSATDQRLKQVEIRLTKIEQMLEILIERSFPEGSLDLGRLDGAERMIIEVRTDVETSRDRDDEGESGKDDDQ
jgi:hypothetical protein